ncbi:MAG: 4Fe-4S dicluster domain-containing protein [Proteobacteria bacterium]|nr:4Fe-4S dicluster domain-containing protein [Pseudomonadota bacterium]MBU1737828.1 4Fe-4S dicluster domain-containing protein [Pseudomonadota bacterium]
MKKLNRRSFLKGGLAGTAVIAGTAVSKNSSAAGNFGGYPDSMGVLVDFTRCVGCRSCEAACNKEQGLPAPDKPFDDLSVYDEIQHNGQKRRTSEKAYTVVNRYEIEGREKGPVFRKFQCNHCNEPACLTSCFVNAYTKTKEGAVIYDPTVCVGCRTCMVACPFYVPAYSYSSPINPVIKKCIMCYDTRLKFGRPPACVEACPQEVMTFGKRNDLIKLGNARIKNNPDKYIDHIYGEKEVGGTAWMYLSDVPFEELGFNTHIGEQPIISYVKEFLTIVPMVLTIWPALFTGFHLLSNRKEALKNEEKTGNK